MNADPEKAHAIVSAGVAGAFAAYAIPARRRAAACCSRIASVNTSNTGMLSFCSSSMKPQRRRPSMSSAFWFRKEPPPNNLISRRCSDRVNSSQGHRVHLDAPCNPRSAPLTTARRNHGCLRRERPPDCCCQHLFCL
jgi:hypothetical protein